MRVTEDMNPWGESHHVLRPHSSVHTQANSHEPNRPSEACCIPIRKVLYPMRPSSLGVRRAAAEIAIFTKMTVSGRVAGTSGLKSSSQTKYATACIEQFGYGAYNRNRRSFSTVNHNWG